MNQLTTEDLLDYHQIKAAIESRDLQINNKFMKDASFQFIMHASF